MDKQNISQYYETDHDRLDELFRNFQALKRTDYPRAKEYFREFKFGLQRHIVWEEEILFPLFEEKTGLKSGGPTEVMRREHRLIGQYLENIHAKVKVADPESDNDEQMLLNTLFLHNQKEEKILYPAIDRSLDPQEHEQVFTKMDGIPEERYARCCTPIDQEQKEAARL
jgi:iron-sulfur cluster repair protein YtfE (RIC family)